MGFLDIGDLGSLHYHEYGSGSKPMLAFHGYGMTGRQFHVLEKTLLQQYHIYGFDHFFHGESKLRNWDEQRILRGMPKAAVRQFVEAWFAQHGRQRFSVMGYSIGANIALIILEEFAEMVDDIILMAPDGLAVYKGFEFLMHKPAGRMLFRTATKSKWLTPTLLRALKRVRFIDDSLYSIAYNEIDTPQKRLDVYYTLNLIRQLKPDAEKIARLINAHQIKCRLIFGKHDHLFPRKAAEPFIAMVAHPEVHELPMGHWLVTKQLDEYLLNLAE